MLPISLLPCSGKLSAVSSTKMVAAARSWSSWSAHFASRTAILCNACRYVGSVSRPMLAASEEISEVVAVCTPDSSENCCSDPLLELRISDKPVQQVLLSQNPFGSLWYKQHTSLVCLAGMQLWSINLKKDEQARSLRKLDNTNHIAVNCSASDRTHDSAFCQGLRDLALIKLQAPCSDWTIIWQSLFSWCKVPFSKYLSSLFFQHADMVDSAKLQPWVKLE